MNKFTLMLAKKGWRVCDAVNRWNITNDTWQRMRKNPKDKNKLTDMIRGLEDKNEQT